MDVRAMSAENVRAGPVAARIVAQGARRTLIQAERDQIMQIFGAPPAEWLREAEAEA